MRSGLICKAPDVTTAESTRGNVCCDTHVKHLRTLLQVTNPKKNIDRQRCRKMSPGITWKTQQPFFVSQNVELSSNNCRTNVEISWNASHSRRLIAALPSNYHRTIIELASNDGRIIVELASNSRRMRISNESRKVKSSCKRVVVGPRRVVVRPPGTRRVPGGENRHMSGQTTRFWKIRCISNVPVFRNSGFVPK